MNDLPRRFESDSHSSGVPLSSADCAGALSDTPECQSLTVVSLAIADILAFRASPAWMAGCGRKVEDIVDGIYNMPPPDLRSVHREVCVKMALVARECVAHLTEYQYPTRRVEDGEWKRLMYLCGESWRQVMMALSDFDITPEPIVVEVPIDVSVPITSGKYWILVGGDQLLVQPMSFDSDSPVPVDDGYSFPVYQIFESDQDAWMWLKYPRDFTRLVECRE